MESGLGLIAACLPSIYGLLRKVRENSQVSKTPRSYESELSPMGLQRLESSRAGNKDDKMYWRTETAVHV